LKKALFLVLISLFAVTAHAQTTGKIAGVITDEAGNPLPGVNVLIEGTLTGNSTDANGNYFILNVRPGSYTFSHPL